MDAGWFLDIPNYAGSGANIFTFNNLAHTLQATYSATFDTCALLQGAARFCCLLGRAGLQRQALRQL